MQADTSVEIRDGDLVTIKQFSEQNPAWSDPSLRWLRFNQESNGLAEFGAFLQVGRKLLINKPAFFAWVRVGQRATKGRHVEGAS